MIQRLAVAAAAFSLALCGADVNSQLFERLQYRSIGPASMGGRITDVEGVAGRPELVYVATASGGLFKTVNGGTTNVPVDGSLDLNAPAAFVGAFQVSVTTTDGALTTTETFRINSTDTAPVPVPVPAQTISVSSNMPRDFRSRIKPAIAWSVSRAFFS